MQRRPDGDFYRLCMALRESGQENILELWKTGVCPDTFANRIIHDDSMLKDFMFSQWINVIKKYLNEIVEGLSINVEVLNELRNYYVINEWVYAVINVSIVYCDIVF
jgi:hypothetical protein